MNAYRRHLKTALKMAQRAGDIKATSILMRLLRKDIDPSAPNRKGRLVTTSWVVERTGPGYGRRYARVPRT